MEASEPVLDLVIDDIAGGGDGIARAPDGRIVFVRGGIPGDAVRARVTLDKARMLKADVVEVTRAGPHRVEPPCPHVARGCGGCGWQHVVLDAQRELKVRMVSEALRRIGGIDAVVDLARPLPAQGFRTSVRGLVDEGVFAFRAARSHTSVPVDSCLVAHPDIEQLLRPGSFGTAPPGTEVTLRVGAGTGERLARFTPTAPTDASLPDDVVIVDDASAGGDAAHFHDVVDGRRFRISADSFFQTRTDGAEALVDAVRAAGGDAWGRGALADLYGGVGLFAGCLGAGMAVTHVEASASSCADARENLRDLDATVVSSPVERWTPSAADLVVADPPRAGLGADAVAVIDRTRAGRVVLVSCDAASFARDAALLREAGLRLVSTVLVDLFPHTPHVELVSRFDRRVP